MAHNPADMLGTKIDDNAIGCVVSLDGKEHGKGNIPNSSDPYPDSGVLYLRLNREDKDSAWFVMSIDYNPEDYQRDIKQQGIITWSPSSASGVAP